LGRPKWLPKTTPHIFTFTFPQEYLRRFADLILTASGLGLSLKHDDTTCTASNFFISEDAVKEANIATLFSEA